MAPILPLMEGWPGKWSICRDKAFAETCYFKSITNQPWYDIPINPGVYQIKYGPDVFARQYRFPSGHLPVLPTYQDPFPFLKPGQHLFQICCHIPKFWTKLVKKDYIYPGLYISYPSSAAAVVFGVHLSARAAFRLDIRQPTDAIRPACSVPRSRTSARTKFCML